MAKVDINTLKNWFKTGLKPTQTQFWNWMDSFFHKDEKIPATNIDGLDEALQAKATTESVNNHKADANAHSALFESKVDKAEGYGLSQNDFTDEYKLKVDSFEATPAPPVADTYSDIAALLAAQNVQLLDYFYEVTDASADDEVTAGRAVYRYLGSQNGDLTDYQLEWAEETSSNTETPESIKIKYESNANTNAFTDALLAKLNSFTAVFTTELKTSYDTAAAWVSNNATTLINHLSNVSNPHTVTKEQIGLGNVPNTDFTTAVTANSAKVSLAADSVAFAELHPRLKNRVYLNAGTEIDLSLGCTFLPDPLTAAIEFTFANLPDGLSTQVFSLDDVTGEFPVTVPSYCVKTGGEYDGTKLNQYIFRIIRGDIGYENVKYSIITED